MNMENVNFCLQMQLKTIFAPKEIPVLHGIDLCQMKDVFLFIKLLVIFTGLVIINIFS